jgi:hypothetical protein
MERQGACQKGHQSARQADSQTGCEDDSTLTAARCAQHPPNFAIGNRHLVPTSNTSLSYQPGTPAAIPACDAACRLVVEFDIGY